MALSQDPEKREKQLANLQTGANGLQGRPKGSRNWSSVVKDVLDDEALWAELEKGMVNKPSWYANQNPKSLLKAIAVAQALKALNGNHFSAEWLRKTGFGDKIDITSNGETLTVEPVVVSVIRARNTIEGEIIQPRQIEGDNEPTTSS